MKAGKTPCIEVSKINFKYPGNKNKVLEDISFTVNSGEYLGIIGPNGGGKTTLLKIILGLIKPNTGTVKIHSEPVETMKDRSHLGYVPQKSSQSIAMFPATVEEIVLSGRTPGAGLFKRLSKEDKEKAKSAMEMADVKKYRKALITELSGGQRQRVIIARALAGEPHTLILDEPTVAVDIAGSQKFYSFLADLNKNIGLTIIFVSHDIDCVAKEVSSVLCLNKRLICKGSPHILNQEKYLTKLYGQKFKLVKHKH